MPHWLHPGRSGTPAIRPEERDRRLRRDSPKILKALDVKGPSVAFEIVLDALAAAQGEADEDQAEADAVRLPARHPRFRLRGRPRRRGGRHRQGGARRPSASSIAGVDVFDVYEGAGIDADKKSVAVAVTLQPTERTLTDAEIDAVSQKIVAEVAKKTGAVLRT